MKPRNAQKRMILAAGLAPICLVCFGCKQTTVSTPGSVTDALPTVPAGRHVTIGVVLPPQDHPGTQFLEHALQEAATANNATLETQYLNDSISGPPLTLALHNPRPEAVILFSYGSYSMDDAVKAANSAHVPAFTVEARANSGQVAEHIHSNDDMGGRLAARRLAEFLHERGGVLILAGDLMPKATRAFRDELSHYPGVHILAETSFQTKPGRSEADVRDAFTKLGKQINGVFALSESAGEQAIEQCNASDRKDIAIVGYCGGVLAQDEMKQGTDSMWKAEVVPSTAGLARAAVGQAIAHLRGKTVPPDLVVNMEDVDASNAEKWEQPCWSRTLE